MKKSPAMTQLAVNNLIPINIRPMDYIPLSDNTARQVIDSTTIFDEFRRVQKQARQYAGGMYWKRQGDYEYLVKTQPDNRQSRIGPRSPDTEEVFDEFTSRKRELEARLKSLRAALTDAERLNKALKAGRVPSIVVTLLQTLEDAGLGQHFTVVGTHALYAYETAAGVRIVQGALATQDVDLLWDARQRVRFLSDMDMIQSFANKETAAVFARLRVRRFDAVLLQAKRKLDLIDAAQDIDFLRVPPGNRLEKLSGDRVGQWSIRINDQWRVCFRFESANAFGVEIVDYH